jgi:hypothetical protein
MASIPSIAALMTSVSVESASSALKSECMSDQELSLVQNASELRRASFPNIEVFTNKLSEHKRNIHETAKLFAKYDPQTEDRHLSYLIFNNHIRNFQDVLMDFLKFVKIPGKEEMDKCFRDAQLKPQDWHCCDYPCLENDIRMYLFLFIRYDPTRGYEKDLDTPEYYGAWVARLDVIMDGVWAVFQEMRYDFWMERDGEKS